MATITKRIGLSLGADICWPICFEELVRRLDLRVPAGGDELRFEVERVTIEPFDLRQPVRFDVVIDRVTHWYHTSREWIKKSVLMNDLYVFNNPWSVQSLEKHSTYSAMMHLGLPVPETWMVPPKEYERSPDLDRTLERYAETFKLEEVGSKLGYPMFIKPFDGGAWVGVNRVDTAEKLHAAYDESGRRIMHLQKAVEGFDLFVRCLGVGPQVRAIAYDPEQPLHDRYRVAFDFLSTDEWELLSDMVLTINTFCGWDFNSCETLRKDGEFYPIDFANACPDSQVTSLHFHFPWLVKAKVKWALFCAATDRKMRRTLDWQPYYDVLERDLPYRERLREYGKIARQRLESERFGEFCDEHLGHFDELALDFFGSDVARDAVRQKVEALFPAHEHDRFTDHFWGLIQFWCKTERDRLGPGSPERDAVERNAVKETSRWYSPNVQQETQLVRWGSWGTPVLLFPTAGGDAEEIERFLMIRALGPLLEAGRVKIYSVDSIAGAAWISKRHSPAYCSRLQTLFARYIATEVVPAIRADCRAPDAEIVTAGSSIGAFNALSILCRHPEIFSKAICMSGSYDFVHWLDGQWNSDFYFGSPIHFVPGLAEDSEQLRRLRTRFVAIPTGEGPWEEPAESWKVAHALGSRGIPNRVDLWGKEWSHDWPTWRAMLPKYLSEMT